MELILLILLGGIPYYLFIENKLKKYTVIFSSFLLILGLFLSLLWDINCASNVFCVVISIITSLFTVLKASKTKNLYKLANYFIFINAPIYLLFSLKYSVFFALSLIFTLAGLYLISYYYENNYGSANFAGIGGLAIAAPFAGFFLRVYLINLALYPPFPNAVFLFNSMIKSELDIIWYLAIIVSFIGNFLVSMRILTNTVFGSPNKNIYYVDLNSSEKVTHFILILILLIIGLYGLKEVIQ